MKLPRHAEIWLAPYCRERMRAAAGSRRRIRRAWVSITDHYEPYWKNQDDHVARERVEVWTKRWPEIAARHQGADGKPPQYSFFYPEDEYRQPELLDSLARLAQQGWGDVEIHLHHDRDSEQQFLDRMGKFQEALHTRHGLLRRHNGRIAFGFIHGNWCLDNSRPDGAWCGVNNEITLLKRLGCYADFTMPCGPSPMQASTVNQIYWAVDDPIRPKSYDRGAPVEAGGDLLMITGPLCLRWAGRLIPRMDTGELAWYDPPSAYRVRRWLDVAPVVGEDCFVKLFTHGTQEQNSALLLGGGPGSLDGMCRDFFAECKRRGWELRYATAWQMRQAVDAAAKERQ